MRMMRRFGNSYGDVRMNPPSVTVQGGLMNYATPDRNKVARPYLHQAEPWEYYPSYGNLDYNGYIGYNGRRCPHVLLLYFTTGQFTGASKHLSIKIKLHFPVGSATGRWQLATSDGNYLIYKSCHSSEYPNDNYAITNGSFTINQSSQNGYIDSYIEADVMLTTNTPYVIYVWVDTSTPGYLGWLPRASAGYFDHTLT